MVSPLIAWRWLCCWSWLYHVVGGSERGEKERKEKRERQIPAWDFSSLGAEEAWGPAFTSDGYLVMTGAWGYGRCGLWQTARPKRRRWNRRCYKSNCTIKLSTPYFTLFLLFTFVIILSNKLYQSNTAQNFLIVLLGDSKPLIHLGK